MRRWQKTPEHTKGVQREERRPSPRGPAAGRGAEAGRAPCRPCSWWARPRGRWEGRLCPRSGGRAQGCGLFRLGSERVRDSKQSKIWAGKKSHKEIGLPPCKMAAFKHLSGGGGPGQRAEGYPGSARWPELGVRKDSDWERDPETSVVPRPGLRRLGRPRPSLSARPSQTPRQQPPDTDPCLQTQPGGGVGRPECWLAGWGRPLAPGVATSSEERGVGARELARQLERTERLVFETVNPLNPYCEGFMQNISGLLK